MWYVTLYWCCLHVYKAGKQRLCGWVGVRAIRRSLVL